MEVNSAVVSKVRTKRHFSTENITDKDDVCINRKVTFVPGFSRLASLESVLHSFTDVKEWRHVSVETPFS